MKKVIIATLLFTMLHSCMGCSDSQSDMEPIPVPQEEYMASDMVIYEANPRIFAEENAFFQGEFLDNTGLCQAGTDINTSFPDLLSG